MAQSKNRRRWADLPPTARAAIEQLVGGAVVAAQNCPGGFSPGLAARLTLAGGRRVFVKAVDVDAPDHQLSVYRAEITVASMLPAGIPAPRFAGAIDEEALVALAFDDIEGEAPEPWTDASVVSALYALTTLGAVPAPPLSQDHPRLGGWAAVDPAHVASLSGWAAHHLDRLIDLDQAGIEAAQGNAVAHFDLYGHNVLMSRGRAYFVDWPHARLASPAVDVVTVLVSAAADGLDAEAFGAHPAVAGVPATQTNAVLAAVAGFLISGALSPMPPGLEPIAAEKRRLGLGALRWLKTRLWTGG